MPKSPISSPRNSGFIPLESMNQSRQQQGGLSPSNAQSAKDDHIVNIPLTPVMTNLSTGARKEGQSMTRPDLNRNATDATEDAGIFHRHMGRRRARKMETGGDASLVEDEGALTAMGRLYEKILNFSVLTRYLLYIIPLSMCFVVVILIGLYVAKDAAIGATERTRGVRIVWLFVWLEIVWCSLWVSKLFAKVLPIIFQTLIGVVSSGVKKYALVIKALEVPISLVGWAIASLCSFLPLMTRNPDQLRANDTSIKEWQRRMNLVLISCLISSLVYLGAKLVIQIVSVDYHRKQFAQRIKTNKENVKFLSQLYEASRNLFPSYTEFAEEDYIIHQSLATNLIIPKQSGSATPMRAILGNINVVQDKVTSAFGNIAQEVTGNKNVFNPNSAYSIVVNALQRTRSSEALARRIWMSFVSEGHAALTKEDLLEVMGPDHEEQALECFSSLDRDNNGDVSLDEMVMHVVHMHNERHDVARSMQDVDNAIRALDSVLSFIVFVIVVLVFVITQQSSVGTTIAGAGTVLISLSFVFALTAQEVLGSCIFLFVKHPFDVGDRVDIDDKRFQVEHISLLYSVFKRVDNNKITQVPNNVLNTKWVENISRSKYMQELVKIGVNYDTSLEDIQKLRDELLVFVRENSRDFQQELEVEVIGINELDKLEIKVEIKHKSNWSNEALTCQRRNKFFCALVKILRKIPIYGVGKGDPVIGEEAKPMFTVAISDDKAHEYMDKGNEAKMALRWDSKKEGEEDSRSQKGKEAGVATGLSFGVSPLHNASSPFYDNRARPSFDGRMDNATVGRPSIESRREDIEEVRGLLKRESTKGRRKHALSPIGTPQYGGPQGQHPSEGGNPGDRYPAGASYAAPPYAK
ncbi:Mechanosensitive ion channel-domain-containing protein [Tuber indicum]|nr:Mechanosensitive ion channel-domain-containing protein [Tuber indicum]